MVRGDIGGSGGGWRHRWNRLCSDDCWLNQRCREQIPNKASMVKLGVAVAGDEGERSSGGRDSDRFWDLRVRFALMAIWRWKWRWGLTRRWRKRLLWLVDSHGWIFWLFNFFFLNPSFWFFFFLLFFSIFFFTDFFIFFEIFSFQILNQKKEKRKEDGWRICWILSSDTRFEVGWKMHKAFLLRFGYLEVK